MYDLLSCCKCSVFCEVRTDYSNKYGNIVEISDVLNLRNVSELVSCGPDNTR